MEPSLPSVVVIQERHVRHGENYRVFRINSRKRQEYITKFLSPKRLCLRYKSKQVVIGRRTKQITYGGSPLATSRLLFIEGLEEPFSLNDDGNSVQNEEKSSEDATLVRSEENSASSSKNFDNTPLYFFNLCDNQSNTGQPITKKIGTENYVRPKPSLVVNRNEGPLTWKYPPEALSDFHFLFESDTINFEDSDDSDEEGKYESTVVETSSEPADDDVNIEKISNGDYEQPIPKKIRTENYVSNDTPEPSSVVNRNEGPLTWKYPPGALPDFHFLFESDTINFEDLEDSDEEGKYESTVGETSSEPADVHVDSEKSPSS